MALRPTMVIAVVLAVAAMLFLAYRRTPNQPRTWATTDDFVQWLASEAVKDANTQSHIQLDYSLESIKTVDKILGQVHEAYVEDPKSVSVVGLGSAYGAYIGEVIRRSEPGVRWERDDPVAGEKSYPLICAAGHSYPMGWCQKRIINGEEDNVWIKYSVLKERASGRTPSGQTLTVKQK